MLDKPDDAETLAERVRSWERSGIISPQQRSAILAHEATAHGPPPPRVRLPYDGWRAEAFAFGFGVIVGAAVAAIAMGIAEGNAMVVFLLAGWALLFAGATVLFSLRNARVWADVFFVSGLGLSAIAHGVDVSLEPNTLGAFMSVTAPLAIAVAIVRLERYVVATLAVATLWLVSVGNLEAMNSTAVYIGIPMTMLVAVITLRLARRGIKAWTRRILDRSRAARP